MDTHDNSNQETAPEETRDSQHHSHKKGVRRFGVVSGLLALMVILLALCLGICWGQEKDVQETEDQAPAVEAPAVQAPAVEVAPPAAVADVQETEPKQPAAVGVNFLLVQVVTRVVDSRGDVLAEVVLKQAKLTELGDTGNLQYRKMRHWGTDLKLGWRLKLGSHQAVENALCPHKVQHPEFNREICN
jgi:hypothetical protein